MILNLMYILLTLILTALVTNISGDVFTDFNSKPDVRLVFDDDNENSKKILNEWNYDGVLSANPIVFEPPFLDFSDTPIGEPKWQQIKILNTMHDNSIHLLSISTLKKDFHCSNFKDQILRPKFNTTFDLVFLPTSIGKVVSKLHIHTSKGKFVYKVSGYGKPSPYRLISFDKFSLPPNESISSPIYFYNPLNNSIQILEMYTSGGDVHLEFPSYNWMNSQKVWNIQPYETRTIMKVKIMTSGGKLGNFTSYLRIRTNNSNIPLGLVLPISMEITNKSEIYLLTDKFYFGLLRSLDSPKSLKIVVYNNGKNDVHIKNILLKEPNPAIDIIFHSLVVPCFKRVTIASITYTGSRGVNSSHVQKGRIVIRTNYNQTLIAPYYVNLIQGSLVYDANNTKFLLNSTVPPLTRRVNITNTFGFTVAIYKINISDNYEDSIKISAFTSPMLIHPQQSGQIEITVDKANLSIDSFVSQLALYTNVSLFMIPIFIFDGKLKVVPLRPGIQDNLIDFGMLQRKTEYNYNFKVKNENPIDITIKSISSNWHLASLKIIAIKSRRNVANKTIDNSGTCIDYAPPVVLKPYHHAVFQLRILSPDINGVFSQELVIETQSEAIKMHYSLRTNDGTLNLIQHSPFKECFPSKVSDVKAEISSSFPNHIELIGIKFIPNDSSIQFEVLHGRNFPILINPAGGSTVIGSFKYAPHQNCLDPMSDLFVKTETLSGSNYLKLLSKSNGKVPCYVGFSLSTNIGYEWLRGMKLNESTIDYDIFVYKRLKSHFDSLVQNEDNEFNVTIQLDTNIAKGFINHINIHLTWPSLLPTNAPPRISLPLTQIGNFSHRFISLHNPSSRPVFVQLVLLSQYPDLISFMKTFPNWKFEISEPDAFSFFQPSTEDGRSYKAQMEQDNAELSYHFQHKYDEDHSQSSLVHPHPDTVLVSVPPRQNRQVRLYFSPTVQSAFKKVKNYVVVRNNLTGIEIIEVEGEGGYGRLSFQNGHNQESNFLQFELTEKHLKNCDVYTKGIPSFSVRRPFVIKNIGKIPVYISGFKFVPYSNNVGGSSSSSASIQIDALNSVYSAQSPITSSNPDLSDEPDEYLSTSSTVSIATPSSEPLWCSGYGFEVVDCKDYKLDINQSVKLEIIFTPDFSLHRVIQQLQIYTSLSKYPYNITVQASLPVYMLHRCSKALARPDSEILIWYMAIMITTLVSIAAMLISYYEADRIFTSNVIYRHISSVALGIYSNTSSSNPTTGHQHTELFDLNSPDYITQDFPQQQVYNESTQTTYRRKKKPNQSTTNDLLFDNRKDEDLRSSATTQALKKKKKRSIFTNTTQWLYKLMCMLTNPASRSPLKPKLDNHNSSVSSSVNITPPESNFASTSSSLSSSGSNTAAFLIIKNHQLNNGGINTSTSNNIQPINSTSGAISANNDGAVNSVGNISINKTKQPVTLIQSTNTTTAFNTTDNAASSQINVSPLSTNIATNNLNNTKKIRNKNSHVQPVNHSQIAPLSKSINGTSKYIESADTIEQEQAPVPQTSQPPQPAYHNKNKKASKDYNAERRRIYKKLNLSMNNGIEDTKAVVKDSTKEDISLSDSSVDEKMKDSENDKTTIIEKNTQEKQRRKDETCLSSANSTGSVSINSKRNNSKDKIKDKIFYHSQNKNDSQDDNTSMKSGSTSTVPSTPPNQNVQPQSQKAGKNGSNSKTSNYGSGIVSLADATIFDRNKEHARKKKFSVTPGKKPSANDQFDKKFMNKDLNAIYRAEEVTKYDNESDEVIEWDNESVPNYPPEDLSILAARTEKFSENYGIKDSRKTYSSHTVLNKKMEYLMPQTSKGFYSDTGYQIDPACQIHGSQSKPSKSHNGHNFLPHVNATSVASASFSGTSNHFSAIPNSLNQHMDIAHQNKYKKAYDKECFMGNSLNIADNISHSSHNVNRNSLSNSSMQHYQMTSHYPQPQQHHRLPTLLTSTTSRSTQPHSHSLISAHLHHPHLSMPPQPPPSFMSLDLHSLAQGRKQSLLEYERRSCHYEVLDNCPEESVHSGSNKSELTNEMGDNNCMMVSTATNGNSTSTTNTSSIGNALYPCWLNDPSVVAVETGNSVARERLSPPSNNGNLALIPNSSTNSGDIWNPMNMVTVANSNDTRLGCGGASGGIATQHLLLPGSDLRINSLWNTSASSVNAWNSVKPGSEDDLLARNLIPTGILSNENSVNYGNGGLGSLEEEDSANLWRCDFTNTSSNVPITSEESSLGTLCESAGNDDGSSNTTATTTSNNDKDEEN